MITPTPQEAREAHKLLADIDPQYLPNGALNTFDAYITASEARISALQLQAEAWSIEAKGHKSTVHEIYQHVSGSTGEPGNWNGAKPVIDEIDRLRSQLAARDALLAEAGEVLEAIRSGDAREPLASKNDKCSHGKYGWEDCENCISDYAASVAQKIREVK